jgi:translation initiation factor IF-3
MAHPEFGSKMLLRIMENLRGIAEKDREARFEGRRFVTIIKGVKGQAKRKES